jgi:hypothetical protein
MLSSVGSVPASRSPSDRGTLVGYTDLWESVRHSKQRQNLRSAFLSRSGSVALTLPRSTHSQIADLQRHFDAVVDLLQSQTSRSIKVALVRLERQRNEEWTAQERARWHKRLAASRALQIKRLQAYRDRAKFPRNEGQAKRDVPIFVDAHGSDCAVGHLMRISGWEDAVDAFVAASNLVYVTDVTEGALVEWVTTSGLTQEEAALIQPSYLPEPEVPLSDLLQPGAFIDRHGLRYENFSFEAQNFEVSRDWEPPPICDALEHLEELHELFEEFCIPPPPDLSPTDQGNLPDPEYGGGLFGDDFFQPGPDYLPMLDPVGTNWAWFHINGYAPEGMAQRVRLSFEVVPILAGAMINQVSVHSDSIQGGLSLHWPVEEFLSDGQWHTTVTGEEGLLHESIIDKGQIGEHGFGSVTTTLDFARQRRIRVENEALMINNASLTSLVFDFNVVGIPEPTTVAILLICLSAGVCSIAAKRTDQRM